MEYVASNIGRTIAKLKALRDGLPEALLRVINPARWLPPLKEIAESTLRELAEPNEQAAVTQFIATIMGTMRGRTAEWRMRAPLREGDAWNIMGKAKEPAEPGVELLHQGGVERARQIVKAWVEADDGKQFDDERGDALALSRPGKYENELVERMWEIFGIAPWNSGGDQSDNAAAAMARIMPHLVGWFESHNAAGVDAEKVELWLRRVLLAWSDYMEEKLPRAVRQELRKLMKVKK